MRIILRNSGCGSDISSKVNTTLYNWFRSLIVNFCKKMQNVSSNKLKHITFGVYTTNRIQMKKIALPFLAFAFSAISLSAQVNYKVNTEISSVEWIGRKVTGQHEGVIQLKNGSYTFENGIITKGVFIVNMQSIRITDIENKDQNEKLQNHLISSDFFAVKDNPIGKLTVLKSEKSGENKLNVFAELTIKGISKRVEFNVTLLKDGKKMVAIGEVDINRTEYDIRYGSGSFFDNLGDKAIKDLFSIKFKVASIQQ